MMWSTSYCLFSAALSFPEKVTFTKKYHDSLVIKGLIKLGEVLRNLRFSIEWFLHNWKFNLV